MVSIKSIFQLLIILFAFSACENIYQASGFVHSTNGEKPLENVIIRLNLPESNIVMDSVLTDRDGLFKVQSGAVGCVPKCPKVELEFIRDDYAILTLNYTEIDPLQKDSLIVKLKPKEN